MIYSYMRKGIDLEKIEIQVSLVPGLPNFHIIGLPDISIRESLPRIKAAIRNCGYSLPQREQVIINLKPSFEKKASQGLDLAIAMAFLIASNQIEWTSTEDDYFYGELSLDGNVHAPNDIELADTAPLDGRLITGAISNPLGLRHGVLSHLKFPNQIIWSEGEEFELLAEKSKMEHPDILFSKYQASIIEVVATGEHNTFVAGPAGSGKSTFCEVIHHLLRPPTNKEMQKINKISKVTGTAATNRPYISPHHSSSEIAILGGGIPPTPGAVTRAQHGILVMDEFLEFDPRVKESLREPIEKNEITISRHGHCVTYPADFLLLANSNLCPCGDFVPTEVTKCGFYSTYCKSYYRKLSGPLLDRFEILNFSHKWRGERVVSLNEVQARVQKAQKFAQNHRNQSKMNSRLSLLACEESVNNFTHKNLMPEVMGSHRRKLSLLRVARTIADLAASPEILGPHLKAAKELTIQPFSELKRAWN